jgi:CheY-like chemotaxis protein
VDDEPQVRKLLVRILRSLGVSAWEAEGGREALALYAQHRDAIGLVVLDVLMPELDGPATFAALHRLDPAVRCCFMSGYPGGYDVEQLLAAGAVGFLAKPFSVADVEALLRQAPP